MEFLNKYSPPFPVGYSDPNIVANYAQYTPEMRPSVPIIFFIDRNYMIRSQYMGSQPFFEGDEAGNIKAEIEKLLAEKPAKQAPPKKK